MCLSFYPSLTPLSHTDTYTLSYYTQPFRPSTSLYTLSFVSFPIPLLAATLVSTLPPPPLAVLGVQTHRLLLRIAFGVER